MGIAKEVFKRYTPDYNKLKEYGFVINGKSCSFSEKFFNDKFRADILITKDGEISDIVFDIENDDEFLPIKIRYNEGSYVAEVKQAYEEILTDIRNKCFIKNYFINSQANRITNLIIETYNDYPEFLWEKFDGSGVFRNSETKKWYGAMLDVDKQKLEGRCKSGKSDKDKNSDRMTEVLNIKLEPDEIVGLLEQKGFYPAYHMNKKYWISILMEDVVSDNLIMSLIEKSYQYTIKPKQR